MYLVNKENVVRFKRGEQSGKVARLVKDRSGSDFKADAQFIGNDVAQGGLAQPRRAV